MQPLFVVWLVKCVTLCVLLLIVDMYCRLVRYHRKNIQYHHGQVPPNKLTSRMGTQLRSIASHRFHPTTKFCKFQARKQLQNP
jgi:hypothetical protein